MTCKFCGVTITEYRCPFQGVRYFDAEDKGTCADGRGIHTPNARGAVRRRVAV